MARCPFCGEKAQEVWMIIHEPGCPAGEEIEPDEDQEDDDEEVT